MLGLEHLFNCHNEWVALFSLLGMIPWIGPWLRDKFRKQKVSNMKVNELETSSGRAYFNCPECTHKNEVDPGSRVSDLIAHPKTCCRCGVHVTWYLDQGSGDRGIVSFAEMAKNNITRQILPFKERK